jgi:hypothetical protein
MLDDHLHTAFFTERRRVREDLAPVHPPLFLLDTEVEGVLLSQSMGVGDDRARVGDRIREGRALLSCREVCDVRLEPARGELLIELRNRLRRQEAVFEACARARTGSTEAEAVAVARNSRRVRRGLEPALVADKDWELIDLISAL